MKLFLGFSILSWVEYSITFLIKAKRQVSLQFTALFLFLFLNRRFRFTILNVKVKVVVFIGKFTILVKCKSIAGAATLLLLKHIIRSMSCLLFCRAHYEMQIFLPHSKHFYNIIFQICFQTFFLQRSFRSIESDRFQKNCLKIVLFAEVSKRLHYCVLLSFLIDHLFFKVI